MVAGNAYATMPPGGASHCSRIACIMQGEEGTVNSVGGKRQFRNNPLALHHPEAIMALGLTVSDANLE